MDKENLKKVKAMLAVEVSTRKVYADALEAVNSMDSLVSDHEALKARMDTLRAEEKTLDDALNLQVAEIEKAKAHAAELVAGARDQAAAIVLEALAKVRASEEEAAAKVATLDKEYADKVVAIAAADEKLVSVQKETDEQQAVLDGIRAKLKAI